MNTLSVGRGLLNYPSSVKDVIEDHQYGNKFEQQIQNVLTGGKLVALVDTFDGNIEERDEYYKNEANWEVRNKLQHLDDLTEGELYPALIPNMTGPDIPASVYYFKEEHRINAELLKAAQEKSKVLHGDIKDNFYVAQIYFDIYQGLLLGYTDISCTLYQWNLDEKCNYFKFDSDDLSSEQMEVIEKQYNLDLPYLIEDIKPYINNTRKYLKSLGAVIYDN